MPELPEVESVARTLRPILIGRVLQGVWGSEMPLRKQCDIAQLREQVGCSLEDITRSGKNLFFHWKDQRRWRVHLGMSGRFLLRKSEDAPLPHTHVQCLFEQGIALHYVDPRRFGFVVPDWGKDKDAPDLLSNPASLEGFVRFIATSGRNLKTLLLDQRIASGMGNIYASEALFVARLHPACAGYTLSMGDIERLHGAAVDVLIDAVEHGGSSLSDTGYRNPLGEKGKNQDHLWVYGRAGLPCRVCQTPIAKTRQGQRTTYFCPHCQNEKPA